MQGFAEALRLGHSGGLTTDEVLTALDKTMLSAMKDLKGETVRGAGFADMPLSADLFHKDAPPMLHTSDGPLAAFDALTQARRAGHGGDDFFRNRQG